MAKQDFNPELVILLFKVQRYRFKKFASTFPFFYLKLLKQFNVVRKAPWEPPGEGTLQGLHPTSHWQRFFYPPSGTGGSVLSPS